MILWRYFDSMVGRLFLFLLVSVTASACLALSLASSYRQADIEKIRLDQLVNRVQDFVFFANSAPPMLRVKLLQNGVPGFHPPHADEKVSGIDVELTRRLSQRLGTTARAEHVIPTSCFPSTVVRLTYDRMHCWLISTRLANGASIRLTAVSPTTDFHATGFDPVYISVLIFGVGVLAFFAARMAAAPLGSLSEAARTLGGDVHSAPLPERGPREVRDAIGAINTMRAKLRRHADERTKILASITHDLQTPLTRLRLRLEKVEDVGLRRRLIDDLHGMQILIREGLDFSRGNQVDEPFAPVALDSLIESLVEEAQERGQAASVVECSGYDVEARPRALQRCLANLLDNALKHGGAAEVSASVDDGALAIRIRDRGPGIPPDQIEAAFEPFVRFENPHHMAEGVGLGLTIARMMAKETEAELSLSNHPDGGLLACLVLRRGLTRTERHPTWTGRRSFEPETLPG
ncbi:MAG TPA: ATP-binding protein [Caulobacteraceae bacterium]|jgi:signal transduction histidine kinase|nr:ATP-binding protein [Caulobacteraceae bacterium]